MQNKSEERPITSAFMKVAELGFALGVKSIKDLPGCWEHQVDEHWRIKVNAHHEVVDGVPPFHCAVDWNGFPAALFAPDGGTFAAGSCANEDTFLEALDRAILKAKETHAT
jgi:hypothetical protein